MTLLLEKPASGVTPAGNAPYWTMRRRDTLAGWLMVLPQLAGIVTFVLVPLGLVVWYSVHEWNVLGGTFEFVGGDNYAALASDARLGPVLKATGLFSVGLVVLNLSLALFLAMLLNQKLRGTVVFRTLFFSPVVVTLVAWTIVWGFLLQDNGGINGFLNLLGIDGPNWLRSGGTAMASVIVVQLFKNVGLNMVLFLAALQGVPAELYEAARIDGASAWHQFWSITVPLVTRTLSFVVVIGTLTVFQLFAEPYVVTGGGPFNGTRTAGLYLYKHITNSDLGLGAANSMLLVVMVLALSLASIRLLRSREDT
jgi:multiple sugar transport system permease protein